VVKPPVVIELTYEGVVEVGTVKLL